MSKDKGNDKNTSTLWEVVFIVALVAAIAIIICIVPKAVTKYDLVIGSAQSYISQPTKEHLLNLESTLNTCYYDGDNTGLLSLRTNCNSDINNSDLDSNSIFSTLFNVLAINNEIEFLKKYYFTYSLDYSTPPGGRFPMRSSFEKFLMTYEGNDVFLLRLKAKTFTDKPRASYYTYTKAFFLTSDLEIRRDIADRIRGILVQFECANEMRAWERYSAVAFRGYPESKQSPLPIEAVNKMQEIVESGSAPELSNSCRLKEYKL